MAKRYTVSYGTTLTQNDDANQLEFDEQIDLAVLLSQRLQRNVRQGHIFKVHKMTVGLTPASGDLDLGMSVSGTVRWTPATKNSCKAWKMAYNTWRKQKALTINAVGQGVRYDDFEVAYADNYSTSRTSTLLTQGMGDTTTEKVCIYGSSTDGHDITLEDLYESSNPQALPSRFPISNNIVKEAKYTEAFPPAQIHNYGANWSTIAGVGAGDPDSGASYNSEPVYFQDTSCLSGIIVAKGYVLAENSAISQADDQHLQLNFTVSIGSPLASKPRGRKRRAVRKAAWKVGKTYAKGRTQRYLRKRWG